MTAFRYQAVNMVGKTVSGVVDAPSPRQARSQLREQGLLVTHLDAAQDGTTASGGAGKPRLDNTSLMLLTRQWATLLEAGLPMEKALTALIEQNEDKKLRTVLTTVRTELLAGHALHRALAAASPSFNGLYCALVAAGEQSGQLDKVMLRLADNLESSGALRQRFIQALIYPALVVLVAVLVIGGLMVYVVPQVVGVFQSSKQALPWLTRALIATSDALRLLWPWLLALGLLLAALVRQAWRQAAVRSQLQGRFMALPVLGRLLVGLDSARLAQTLAILVGSSVPLLASLQAAAQVVWLLPLRRALEQAADEVREGVALHRALAKSRHFPPLLVHMIASGEASGRLDHMLDKAAKQQADEVSNRLTLGMSLLEPLLILGMGAMVLLIVLAILQPIIEINQLLH